MFNYQEEWSDAAVRRLVARVGEEKIDDLMALRRADQIGMCRENAAAFPQGLADFAARVHSVMQEGKAFSLRGLAVNGTDLMQALAIPPGPMVGIMLNELLQAVLDDPGLNEKAKLLEIAARLRSERLGS
jgi:tRNA nucleotidyltransferase (CCA-adding enzyme)